MCLVQPLDTTGAHGSYWLSRMVCSCGNSLSEMVTSDSLQLIVPRELQREVLWNAHDGLLGGHLGQKKTREKVLRKFCWRGIREDCNNWVNTCDVCARQKRLQRKPHAPLGSMATGAPLDCLATDILGPFPESTRGNKYVLAVTDYFTKGVEIFPIPDQNCTHMC